MKYAIVEIGTSDFRIDSLNSTGNCILVEPSKFYLDRIENRENITKINAAISNYDGITKIYYTNLDYIIKNKLPNWLRGCNSIQNPHPTVVKYCSKHNINIDDLVIVEEIQTITPQTLFENNNITHIDYLKIDTEGHDIVILDAILDTLNKPTIDIIKFESNVLTDEISYRKICKRLASEYTIERLEFDTICKIKNK